MKGLLSVEQVSGLLGVSEAWVYQHSCGRRRPHLPSVKLGRVVKFRPDALEAFVAGLER